MNELLVNLLRTAVHLIKIYLRAIKNNSAMGRDPLRTRHQKSNYEMQVGREVAGKRTFSNFSQNLQLEK